MEFIEWDDVLSFISDSTSAFRKRVRLYPAGGPGSKVFPPTYVIGESGGNYAMERRRFGEEVLNTVLLDSVQSQANRMEQALLNAQRRGSLKIPLIQVNFNDRIPELNGTGLITTLDAPHRIADAIFRDSCIGEVKFRESEIGKDFAMATARNATKMLKWCPHALIFGVWDSTGAMGGLGNKFQRVITSEIIGVRAEKGVHTSSRIDPLGITTVSDVFEDESGEWTLDPDKAKKNKEGKPEKIAPSKVVHGNIPPTIEMDKNEPIRGGVTIDYALQTSVISLPAIRKLHFPIDAKESLEVNNAGRALLAALSLYGLTAMEGEGYDLRSGCLLIPDGKTGIEIISNDGNKVEKNIDLKTSTAIMDAAIENAKEAGLPWEDNIVTLQPSNKLVELVRASRITRKKSQAEKE
ncbi:MAG: type I-U CRISPR-associated RAMP protein Csb1/Cas7u [Thermoplasmatales archaeon]